MVRRDVTLAVLLTALAGYVDATGYLSSGGMFVAFMSGNSTVMGVAVAQGLDRRVLLGAGLVGAFVCGVAAGAWAGRLAGPRRARGTLLLLAAGLAGAGGLHEAGWDLPAVLLLAGAMGAENTVFERSGQPGTALTYMTGALVRIGWRLADLLGGRPGHGLGPDLLMWAGMVAGAAAGSALFLAVGLRAIWLAAAAAAALAWVRP